MYCLTASGVIAFAWLTVVTSQLPCNSQLRLVPSFAHLFTHCECSYSEWTEWSVINSIEVPLSQCDSGRELIEQRILTGDCDDRMEERNVCKCSYSNWTEWSVVNSREVSLSQCDSGMVLIEERRKRVLTGDCDDRLEERIVCKCSYSNWTEWSVVNSIEVSLSQCDSGMVLIEERRKRVVTGDCDDRLEERIVFKCSYSNWSVINSTEVPLSQCDSGMLLIEERQKRVLTGDCDDRLEERIVCKCSYSNWTEWSVINSREVSLSQCDSGMVLIEERRKRVLTGDCDDRLEERIVCKCSYSNWTEWSVVNSIEVSLSQCDSGMVLIEERRKRVVTGDCDDRLEERIVFKCSYSNWSVINSTEVPLSQCDSGMLLIEERRNRVLTGDCDDRLEERIVCKCTYSNWIEWSVINSREVPLSQCDSGMLLIEERQKRVLTGDCDDRLEERIVCKCSYSNWTEWSVVNSIEVSLSQCDSGMVLIEERRKRVLTGDCDDRLEERIVFKCSYSNWSVINSTEVPLSQCDSGMLLIEERQKRVLTGDCDDRLEKRIVCKCSYSNWTEWSVINSREVPLSQCDSGMVLIEERRKRVLTGDCNDRIEERHVCKLLIYIGK